MDDPRFALKMAEPNMHTDDIMISFYWVCARATKTLEDLHIVLNPLILRFEKWSQGNKLSLNVVKTHVMING